MCKKVTGLLAVLTFIGWAGSVNEATVTADGVWGLEVGGVSYDISIGDMGGMTAGQVYAGYGLTSTADPDLVAINNALVGLFNTDVGNDASFFDGCSDATSCVVFLPTLLSGPTYLGIPTPQLL